MINKIFLKGQEFTYNLEYKNVRNINLRIKSDGTIFVTANRSISRKTIEEFMTLKADFILRAVEKFANTERKEKTQYFTESEIKSKISEICRRVYPCYEKRGIPFPEIKFRKMVSQWGNCRNKAGILTFNTNLMYAPLNCVEYVVWHEFTHFIEANHSPAFYAELEKVCPDWKKCRNMLKEINLR